MALPAYPERMFNRMGRTSGAKLADRLTAGGERLDRVIPAVRWLRWLSALLAVWAVMALAFYFVSGTQYSPSAEGHVAGDWVKSGAIGATFAAGTFVWLRWRDARDRHPPN